MIRVARIFLQCLDLIRVARIFLWRVWGWAEPPRTERGFVCVVFVWVPYEFIWFGALDVTKPYQFIGFGAIDVTNPYKFIRFGAIETPNKPPRQKNNNRNNKLGT